MSIDLRKMFLSEALDKTVEYDLEITDIELNGVNPFQKPVHVIARFQSAKGNVQLTLLLSYTLVVPCDRCFEDAVIEQSLCLDHVLVRSQQPDQDVNVYILISEYQLDMKTLVFADVMLNLPTKLLCKEDCKGLCPICGQNLNQDNCYCDKKQVDPRLEALKQLLD